MALNSKWLTASVLVVVVVCGVIVIASQYQTNQDNSPDKRTLFQLQTFNTFSTGKYAGVMSYDELEHHGDFGIGTFDALDGEMIALDGVFYQIPSSGLPQEAQSNQTAPYATVSYFEADKTFSVSNLTYAQLRTYIDGKLASKDVIYAIKVGGTFQVAQTRSPEKQAQPYPNITDALKNSTSI